MRIPDSPRARAALYRNLIRECEVTREDRRATFRRLRQAYLTGAIDGRRTRYNKLKEHVRESCAFLYAPESVRFGVVLPPHYGDQFLAEEEVARDELHRLWHDTDAGLIFGLGVEQGHYAPTAVFKVVVSDGEPRLTLLPDPSDLGAWAEELAAWDAQEALVHWYVMDLPAFERMIDPLPAERRAALKALAEEDAVTGDTGGSATLPPAVERTIILSQATPSMVGFVNEATIMAVAEPRSQAPKVRLAELWVRDDDLRDFRVATLLLPSEHLVWDVGNPLEPGQHPFVPLTLAPLPDYLWGVSLLEDLIPLQEWREERLQQIRHLMTLQYKPPRIATNVGGILEERLKALNLPETILPFAQPNADVKSVAPPMPPDAFTEVQEIDKAFASMGGLGQAGRGQDVGGIRSGEQAATMGLMAASPMLALAMRVEDCLEAVATAILRLQRRVSDIALRKPDGQEYLLSQMPADLVARVAAHSASPVFQAHLMSKVAFAKQAGAIDNEALIELLNLPMQELLRTKARKLAVQQAQLVERKLAIEELRARQGRPGRR